MPPNLTFEVPTLDWEDMDSLLEEQIEEYRRIHSGIHIAIIASNRSGKTTLATGGGNEERGILSHFENVLVLDTTGDPGFIHDYGKPVQKYQGIRGIKRLSLSDMTPKSKEKLHRYITKAVRQGNVAIYCDELRQVCEKKFFGFAALMEHIWLFEAKHGTSLIAGSQAPRWLPGAFYDQSKLHFIYHLRDKRSKDRLGEIAGDTDTIKAEIGNLKRYQFLQVGLDGEIVKSKFELKTKQQRQASKRVVIRA